MFFKSAGLLRDCGSGDFTEDTWFSSATNPGFLMEAEQSMDNVVVAPHCIAVGRRAPQRPQEQTVLLKLAK